MIAARKKLAAANTTLTLSGGNSLSLLHFPPDNFNVEATEPISRLTRVQESRQYT